MSETLFVSGASGQLGSRVVALLRAGGHTVIAGTRSPERLSALAADGVEVRRIDFNDPDSFASALAGVDRALLISTDAIGARVDGQIAAVKAAAAAGVSHVVYTSVIEADNPEMAVSEDHRGTEQAIEAAFDSYTILRNNLYADMVPGAMAQAVATGKLITARGAGKIAWVQREDCARAAAAALSDGFSGARTLDITGPQALSGDEMAALFAELSGKPVVHVPVSGEALGEGLSAAGLPAPLVAALVGFDLSAEQGLLGRVSGDLAELTGAPGATLRSVLASSAS